MAVSDQSVATGTQLDQLCINTIRTLSMDAVQAANSGHPGTPMALAPVAYLLWQRYLRFDPADPIWPNRDRFVLSNGHASMLLYSLLHLTGVQADDTNHITIEGNTARAFGAEAATRFIGYGWNVTRVGDANDLDMLGRALDVFEATDDRPPLIIVDSHIGYGAPTKQDTSAAHGEPLGEQEIRLAKRFYGWPEDAKFLVPDGVRAHFDAGIGARGATLRGEWNALFKAYGAKYPK